MRIGFFTETYLPRNDGIAYSIATFRQGLEELGHEVYVFAPTPQTGYRERDPHVIRFPSVPNYLIHNYRTGVFFPPLVVRKIEKLRLDLIHFHTPSPIGLLGAFIASSQDLPLVSTYHTDMYQYVSHYPALFPGVLALSLVAPLAVGAYAKDFEVALSLMKPERNLDAWNKKIVRRMTTVVHNRCDLVIAPSQKMEQQLKSWGTRSPISVLPTGVDQLAATPEEIEQFQVQHHIPKGRDIILFVGRLGSEKNVEQLIESLPRVLKEHPQAHLLIVGDDKNRSNLQKQVRELGLRSNVTFTGYVERSALGAAYGLATLFAFPSHTDTQGLVLHEAAWARLPIVMTDPLITQVVEPDRNGLIAPSDPRHFAPAILKLLKDPDLRERMGQAGYELAHNYSASKQTAKLLRLYQKVSAHERRPDA